MVQRRIRHERDEAYKPSDYLRKKHPKRFQSSEVGMVQGDDQGIQLELSFELINHPISEHKS